jgi:serine phosphatase RsbU (regulator of sigma subunit)
VLLDAIARVSESRDLEQLLVDIVDRSIEITKAERGLLLLAGPDGELAVRVARQRGGRPVAGELRFSTSIAKRVVGEAEPVRATVSSDSEALELGQSVYDLKLRAVMCVPLRAGSSPASPTPAAPPGATGCLYVDSRAASRQFSQRDLGLFAALAQHISIALENARLHIDRLEKVRLEQSLELASAIQRDLMPDVPRDVPGYELFAFYRPAEQAGADFYDAIKLRDGRVALVVGDATGHGIGPALITASAQASLRSYLRLVRDPAQAVALLNQDLCERIHDGRFLTLFLALGAPDGKLACINAGHAETRVRRARGAIERLGTSGPALGMLPDAEIVAREVELAVGDVVLLFTDGLSEARSKQDPDALLGEDGVDRLLEAACRAGGDARAIGMRIAAAALEFCGEKREDDLTLLLARRAAPAADESA